MKNGIYHLKLTLRDRNGRIIKNEEGLRLAEAAAGIGRDVLVPGDTTLLGLHLIIQSVFGWRNLHLHRFSLPEKEFGRVTLGEKGIYDALCGVMFRRPDSTCGEWRWHKLFREVSEEKTQSAALIREMLKGMYKTGKMSNVTALSESFYFANRMMSENPRNIREGMNYGISRMTGRFSSPEEMQKHNVLLDRLKIAEIFAVDTDSEQGNRHRNRSEWKKRLSESVSFRQYELMRHFKERTRTFLRLKDYAGEYEKTLGEYYRLSGYYEHNACMEYSAKRSEYSRKQHMQRIAGHTHAAYAYGGSAELDETKIELARLSLAAAETMHGFNPEIRPGFASVEYAYDCGDGWKVNISCLGSYVKNRKDNSETAICSMPYITKGKKTTSDKTADKAKTGSSIFDTGRQFWINHNGVKADDAACRALDKALKGGEAVCLGADGLNLTDDVGGTEGFFRFLKSMHSRDREERLWAKELAGMYGWEAEKPEAGAIIITA